jgi:hypothetical protein
VFATESVSFLRTVISDIKNPPTVSRSKFFSPVQGSRCNFCHWLAGAMLSPVQRYSGFGLTAGYVEGKSIICGESYTICGESYTI